MGSDIDLLACVVDGRHEFDPESYSIYTYDRLEKLWLEGNPFAWHLFKESRLIYTSDNSDFLDKLGCPNAYREGKGDCEKFHSLFLSSKKAVDESNNSFIFNLSSIFLSIRNIATCYSLKSGNFVFSRKSAYLIDPPIEISMDVYSILERARILATRGYGAGINNEEANLVRINLGAIESWMNEIMRRVSDDE